MVEELLDMMRTDQEAVADGASHHEDQGAECCTISREALDGTESPTTMRLHGWVQQREVLMLVDSGSSHSFVCSSLAQHLQGVQKAQRSITVRVADGGEMRSNQEIPDCEWSTQGAEFRTNFKVLPLGSYDVILGIDWLARHSPMQVHWFEKTTQFEHAGRQVQLCGAKADVTQYQMLSGEELNLLLQRSGVARVLQLCSVSMDELHTTELPVPSSVQALLQQYDDQSAIDRPAQKRHSVPLDRIGSCLFSLSEDSFDFSTGFGVAGFHPYL